MPSATHAPIAPPSRLLLWAESRALWEAAAGVALWPLLQLAPRGDGHAVLVLPGLLASDASTRMLRRYLASRGYEVHGWGQGRNLGPRAGVEASMVAKLQALQQGSGSKVSLVGQSLGGVYARLLAAGHGDLVRSVITLGSPFVGSARATNAWQVYERVSGLKAEDPQRQQQLAPPPGVPTSSVFSRSDGVVAWRASLVHGSSAHTENIEVLASHIGMAAHPAVLYAVADRLAQPEGAWKPFNRRLLGPLVYPNPNRA